MVRHDATLLVTMLLIASDSTAAERPATPLAAKTRTQLTVMQATFDVPPNCVAECRFSVDAYGGGVTCKGASGTITYGAGIEGLAYQSPLRRADVGVQESLEIGEAVAYWGTSHHDWAGFCAIASYPFEATGKYLAAHSFCTTSPDPQLRERTISMVRSFRRAGKGARETCGLLIEK
jgi:hypothetical protein